MALINSCSEIKNYLKSRRHQIIRSSVMRKPAIVSLSFAQRQEVIATLKECDYPYKDLVLDTLDFVKVLMEELKSGKITTGQLKKILLSLDQETLKKLTRIH